MAFCDREAVAYWVGCLTGSVGARNERNRNGRCDDDGLADSEMCECESPGDVERTDEQEHEPALALAAAGHRDVVSPRRPRGEGELDPAWRLGGVGQVCVKRGRR